MEEKMKTISLLAALILIAWACTPTQPGGEKEGTGKSGPQDKQEGKAVDKPADKPAEPTADKPADKPAEPTADKPADKPAEPTTDKPAEKPGETSGDKPADDPGASRDKPATPDEEVPVKTDDPPPPATTGSVSMEAVPQFSTVLSGKEQDFNFLVRLKGAEGGSSERPPLDLAIVLDRSGSMRGDKIQQVKKAAMDLVDKMDRVDRVTLISYNTYVTVHDVRKPMDEPGRNGMKEALSGLSASDRTALGPAMFRAFDILGEAKREDSDVAHVLLLSDGIANVGETRPEALAGRAAEAFARGISVSTLGVGLDYHEDLMTRVADQGGGKYHFIKDANEIAGVLNDELAGLSASVARGIVLHVRPRPGVHVAKVFGYPMEDDDGLAMIKVGALHSGQTRDILVRLRLPALDGSRFDLATLSISWSDLLQEGKTVENELPFAVDVSSDPEVVRKSERADVSIRVAEVESARMLDDAARAVDRGDYDGARHIIRGSIGLLESQNAATPSAKLMQRMDEMEAASAGVGAAESSAEEKKVFIKSRKAEAYDWMK